MPPSMHPKCSVARMRRHVSDELFVSWVQGESPSENASRHVRAELRLEHVNLWRDMWMEKMSGRPVHTISNETTMITSIHNERVTQNHTIGEFFWVASTCASGSLSVTPLHIATVFSLLFAMTTMAALTNIMSIMVFNIGTLFSLRHAPVILLFVSCSTPPVVVLAHFAMLHAGTWCAVVVGFLHLPSSRRQEVDSDYHHLLF